MYENTSKGYKLQFSAYNSQLVICGTLGSESHLFECGYPPPANSRHHCQQQQQQQYRRGGTKEWYKGERSAENGRWESNSDCANPVGKRLKRALRSAQLSSTAKWDHLPCGGS